jgi:hypothetical protein
MVCDLQMTHRTGMKFKSGTKIIQVPNAVQLFNVKSALLGYSGGATQWSNAVGWLHLPEGRLPKMKDIEFLMLTEKKHIFHSVDLTNWTRIKDEHFSIGSGSQFAMGAMKSGSTVEDAVRAACLLDPYSGFGIKSYNI